MAFTFTSNTQRIDLQQNDVAKVGAGIGDDVYVIDADNFPVGQKLITIDDAQADQGGNNKLVLVGGLQIVSSKVYPDALELTLSNEVVVRVLGASTFLFQTGGAVISGQGGVIQSYQDFVTAALGTTVPAAGTTTPSTGGAVSVNPNGGTTIPGAATYELTAAAANVDEGATATFNLVTTGVANGTEVAYTITGVDAADVTGSLTGKAVVTDGKATISVPVKADTITEGAETLTVTLDGKSVSAQTTVNDTSLSAPTFSVAADALVVAEGQSATFTVTASRAVDADTKFSYSTAGVGATADDFTGLTSGEVTIKAGETSATFTVGVKADNVAELAEGFTVTVKDSNGAAVGAKTVDIQDVVVDLTAPVVTAQAGVATYAENGAADVTLATVTATDNVGVTGYTIVSGNDAGFFQINEQGQISLTAAGADKTKAANDFETAPNDFVLGIKATDAAGNTSATAVNYTLRVTDVDDRAPVLTGAIVNGTKAILSYDETLGATAAKAPAITDFAVGIKGAAGSISVTGVKVVGTTVELTLGRAPTPGEVFTVTYTPRTNPVEDVAGNDVLAITARDLVVDATAPVITAAQTISYAEDIVTGVTASRTTSTVLGKVVATDDTGVVSYNITAGNTSGFFAIDGSGNITMTAAGLVGAANDFEVTPNSVVLTVTATDGAGNVSAAQQVTLAETNVTSDDAAPLPTPAVITLTAGADSATPTSVVAATKTTAGNDTITAFFDGAAVGSTLSTISLADAIDAGGGTADKLTLTLANGGTAFDAIVGPVLNGVEILELRPTGGTANVVTLTSVTPNVTSLVFDAPSGAGATVSGVANAVNTFGLTNANITTTVALTANSASGLTGTADAVTINLSANAGLATDRTTGTTLSILGSAVAGGSGYEVVTINSTGGASAIKWLDVADKGSATTSLTSLTVNGSSNLTIADALEFNGSAGTKGTVSASNFTGNLDLTFDGGVATANTITGGSGNDRFNFFTATKFDGNDVINGGTGTDTLSLADPTLAVATQAAIIAAVNAGTSIEKLEQTAAAAAVEANAFTQIHSFVFSNAAAAATVTKTENVDTFSFTGAGAKSAFTELTASASDVLNLSFDRAGGTLLAGTIGGAGYETVNLALNNSTGLFDGGALANSITLAAGGTLVITGAGSVSQAAALNGITLGAAANINASAATGKLNLNGEAGANSVQGGTNDDLIDGAAGNDTIVGNGGNDTITGGADADQLTGGAGNDTFIIAAAADTFSATFAAANTTTANIDRITDFAGNGALAGDTIQVTTAGIVATVGAPVSVTAFTVANANSFNDLAGALAGIQASAGGGAAGLLSVADVTVSAGSLAGRYVIINDGTAGYAAGTDAIIGLTGITGALHASDFVVV